MTDLSRADESVRTNQDTDFLEFFQKIASASSSKALKDCVSALARGDSRDATLAKYAEDCQNESKINEIGALIADETGDWRQKLRSISPHIGSSDAREILRIVGSPKTPDDKIRFLSLMVGRSRYAEDLFMTRASVEWLDDPHFQQAYEAGASISNWGTKIRWRIYTLLRAAKLASRVEGDFVECGVNNGGCSKSVIAYLGADTFRDRKFYLFDTYQGLVDSQLTDSERSKWSVPDGYYPNVLEKVRQNFKDDEFSQIVVGAVPDTLSEFKGDKVAYVHIDMNVALPEVEAFRFFWPKLSSGGVVVFDDYGFPSHVEQQRGLDAVARDFGVEIMMLPTGQGIVWK